MFYRGWAIAELGEVEKGIADMEDGIAGFERLGGVPRDHFALAMLAQGYQRLGRLDEALAIFNQALAHVERTTKKLTPRRFCGSKANCFWLAMVHRRTKQRDASAPPSSLPVSRKRDGGNCVRR